MTQYDALNLFVLASVIVVGGAFILLYTTPKRVKVAEELTAEKPEPDNAERQLVYLAKNIMRAESEDEIYFWHQQIKEFVHTFHDHPDICDMEQELKQGISNKLNGYVQV